MRAVCCDIRSMTVVSSYINQQVQLNRHYWFRKGAKNAVSSHYHTLLGRDSPNFFPPLKAVLPLAGRIAIHQKIIAAFWGRAACQRQFYVGGFTDQLIIFRQLTSWRKYFRQGPTSWRKKGRQSVNPDHRLQVEPLYLKQVSQRSRLQINGKQLYYQTKFSSAWGVSIKEELNLFGPGLYWLKSADNQFLNKYIIPP